jgi:hypothetical protein
MSVHCKVVGHPIIHGIQIARSYDGEGKLKLSLYLIKTLEAEERERELGRIVEE